MGALESYSLAAIGKRPPGCLHNEKPRRSGAKFGFGLPACPRTGQMYFYQTGARLRSRLSHTNHGPEARAPLPAWPKPSTCARTPRIPPSPLPVTPRDCRCAGCRAGRESAAPRTSANTPGRCGSYRCGRCTTRRRRRCNRRCLCRHRGLARSAHLEGHCVSIRPL